MVETEEDRDRKFKYIQEQIEKRRAENKNENPMKNTINLQQGNIFDTKLIPKKVDSEEKLSAFQDFMNSDNLVESFEISPQMPDAEEVSDKLAMQNLENEKTKKSDEDPFKNLPNMSKFSEFSKENNSNNVFEIFGTSNNDKKNNDAKDEKNNDPFNDPFSAQLEQDNKVKDNNPFIDPFSKQFEQESKNNQNNADNPFSDPFSDQLGKEKKKNESETGNKDAKKKFFS